MQYLGPMHGALGNSYYGLGKLETAEKMYKKQLKYAKLSQDQHSISLAYINNAQLALLKNDFEAAREYNKPTLKIGLETKDESLLGASYGVSGMIELKSGNDYKKAVEYFNKSIKSFEKVKNYSWLSYARVGLAASEGYLANNDPEPFIKRMKSAIKLCKAKGRIIQLIEGYIILGDFAGNFKQSAEARQIYSDALKLARKHGMAYFVSLLTKKINNL